MKRTMKAISLIMAIAIIFSVTLTTFSFAETSYDKTTLQYDATRVLSKIRVTQSNTGKKAPIVSGYTDGQYHPEDPITRAQMAAIMNRSLPNFGNTSLDVSDFDDSKNAWFSHDVLELRKKGVIVGSGNNKFRPNDTLTINEVYIMTLQLLRFDVRSLGGAKGILDKITQLKINTGITKTQNDKATRGDAFLILLNAFEVNPSTKKYPMFYYMEGVRLVEGIVTNTVETSISCDNAIEIDGVKYDITHEHESVADLLGHRVKAWGWFGGLYVVSDVSTKNILIDGGFIEDINGSVIKVNNKTYNLSDYTAYMDGRSYNPQRKIEKGMFIKLINGEDNIKKAVIISFDSCLYETNVVFAGWANGRLRYNTVYGFDGLLDARPSEGPYDSLALYPTIYKNGSGLSPNELCPGDIISFKQVDSSFTPTVFVIDNEKREGIISNINAKTATVNGKQFSMAYEATYSWNGNKDISLIPYNTKDLLNTKVSYRLNDKGEIRHIFYKKSAVSQEAGIVIDKKTQKVGSLTKNTVVLYNVYSSETKEYQYLADAKLNFSSINTFNDKIAGYDVIFFKDEGEIITDVNLLKPTSVNGLSKIPFDETTPIVKVNLKEISEYGPRVEETIRIAPIQYTAADSKNIPSYPYKLSELNQKTLKMYKSPIGGTLPILFIFEE